jgi:hypothetical protein
MLVVCLLAASFTGCLGSDDIEPSIVKEEDTIEPVGTGDNGGNETNNYNETNHYFYNNDTYYVNGTDYLELISQVENLTVAVEELTHEVKVLTDVLEEMQSSKYEVLENSSMIIYHIVENESAGQATDPRHIEPLYQITKEGNTITVEYLGASRGSVIANSPSNCTSFNPDLSFYGHDDDLIATLSGGNTPYEYILRDDVEVIMNCEVSNEDSQWYDFWSTIIITLPEEPVRLNANGNYHNFN